MGIPTLPIQTSKRRRRPVCLAPATVAIDKDLRLIDKVAVGVQTVMISHHHDIVYVVHVHVTRSNSSSLLAARCNATASQSGFRGSNRPVARRPAAGMVTGRPIIIYNVSCTCTCLSIATTLAVCMCNVMTAALYHDQYMT